MELVLNPFVNPEQCLYVFSDSIPVNSTPEEFDAYLRDYLKLDECLTYLYSHQFNDRTYGLNNPGDYEKLGNKNRRILFVCIALYEVLCRRGNIELIKILVKLHPRLLYIVCQRRFTNEQRRKDSWDWNPRTLFRCSSVYDLPMWLNEERSDLFRLLFGLYTPEDLKGPLYSISCNKYKIKIGKKANAELIDTLIKYNHEFTWYELYGAAYNRNVYAVRKMLEMGVLQQDKPRDWESLHMFSPSFEGFISYNIEIMRLFMAYGGNPREIHDGMNIFTIFLIRGATQEETKGYLIELLGYGVDVSTPDEDGD